MKAAPQSPLAPWRDRLRRHERALAILYLGLVVLAALLLGVATTRGYALAVVQRIADRWDRRWSDRVAAGERLVEADRFREAAGFLEQLARDHPAPSVEFGRDIEHERVLRLLARAEEGLGRARRTMAVYDRLIAYDPNDYYNHFLKARAAERMLSGWAVAPEARAEYGAVLQLFPNHLPSLRGVIAYHADRGEYPNIVEAYRAYLDAALVLPVGIAVGDTTFSVPVRVDGQPHEIVLRLPQPAADTLVVRPMGLIVALGPVRAMPAIVVGGLTPAASIPVGPAGLRTSGMSPAAHGAWRPADSTAMMRVELPRLPAGLVEVRIEVRAFKPVDADLWSTVRRSYVNLLDAQGLAAAEEVTASFLSAQDADNVLLGRAWARAGLGPNPVLR